MEVIFGTRGSQLALIQTDLVVNALKAKGFKPSIKVVETTGCKRQGTDSKVDDKKQWIHELELALENKEIDIAVHSAKDVPCNILESTILCSVLQREEVQDVFIPDSSNLQLSQLSSGSKIGTASLRRAAQILNQFPNLQVVPLRGNINTRIQKVKTLGLNGAVLARAGLNRMSIKIGQDLDLDKFLPTANQGILCLQFLKSRHDLAEAFQDLTHSDTEIEFLAERRIIKELGADCRSSLGVNAKNTNGILKIRCSIFSIDGSKTLNYTAEGSSENWEKMALDVSNYLINNGAKQLLCG